MITTTPHKKINNIIAEREYPYKVVVVDADVSVVVGADVPVVVGASDTK